MTGRAGPRSWRALRATTRRGASSPLDRRAFYPTPRQCQEVLGGEAANGVEGFRAPLGSRGRRRGAGAPLPGAPRLAGFVVPGSGTGRRDGGMAEKRRPQNGQRSDGISTTNRQPGHLGPCCGRALALPSKTPALRTRTSPPSSRARRASSTFTAVSSPASRSARARCRERSDLVSEGPHRAPVPTFGPGVRPPLDRFVLLRTSARRSATVASARLLAAAQNRVVPQERWNRSRPPLPDPRPEQPPDLGPGTSLRPTGVGAAAHGPRLPMAVVHGNRTRREHLSAPHTGFEDRAGHQSRAHYRSSP